ncbi:MAG: hypothetical protein IKQ04_03365 [Oscillospiraceae bacterium]|nr:hypothetical protein [Oscillospiraceae bacterium]
MKRKQYYRIMIALLALCLLLSGCKGSSPSASDSSSDSPEDLINVPATEPVQLEDPYPPEAYEYSLGALVDVDFSDEDWANRLAEDGQVYQVVYQYDRENDEQFDPMDLGAFIPLRVVHYSAFPAITNTSESETQLPLFHGRYRLEVAIENPNQWFLNRFDAIYDPSVFAALEELVMGLEYVPVVDDNRNPLDLIAKFRVTGAENNDEYAIGRDGSVFRNGSEAAVVPLSEEATDYFYAIVHAWRMTGFKELNFFTNITEIETYKALRVRSENEEVYLTRENANALAGLLSDREYYNFSCRPVFNCELDGHGEALYEIALGDYDPELGLTSENRVYTLWSDGHLSVPWYGGTSYGVLDHDQICDRLIVPCWYVSETAFDIAAVEAFLAEHGG